MLLSLLRSPGRLCRNWLRLAVLMVLIVLSVDLLYTAAIAPHSNQIMASFASPSNQSVPQPHNDRIFIASMHWNTEIAIRSNWSASVLDLVQHLGAENVYISIIESGSWDDTKDALRDLDQRLGDLGVQRSIELRETTHKDEVEHIPGPDEKGWVWTSRGKKELRRIPYLAKIRNQVMGKLNQLAQKLQWIERPNLPKDPVTEDVTTLLATRNGDYAAACSLDFGSNPTSYYDTFALRDIAGAKAISQTWPYFLSATSRRALISNSAVPVKSCWNGMAVFQAASFYRILPLRFRGISDSLAAHHLEGSECCLIHIDNDLTAQQGVWLNPNVRITYDAAAYRAIHPESGLWPNRMQRVRGIWWNRLTRWTGFPGRYLEQQKIGKRIRLWRDDKLHNGHGQLHPDEYFCVVDETQVLVENGWAHL